MQNAGLKGKDAKRIMTNVMKIETALADSAWTREQSRNIPAMYNPFTFAKLKETYPGVNWDRFFIETMGIPSPETVIVTEPNFCNAGCESAVDPYRSRNKGLLPVEICGTGCRQSSATTLPMLPLGSTR